MRLALALAVLVGLTGCPKRVVVPRSAMGMQCARECGILFNTCLLTGAGDLPCANQQHDCLMTCPGAYETEDEEHTPVASVAPPPRAPFAIRLKAAEPYLTSEASRLVKCPAEKVTLRNHLEMDDGGRCVAEACGHTIDCTWAESSMRTPQCTETAESAAEALKGKVVARLAFETQCEASTIEVLQATTGAEAMYRLKACGALHVCAVEDGKISCRKVDP